MTEEKVREAEGFRKKIEEVGDRLNSRLSSYNQWKTLEDRDADCRAAIDVLAKCKSRIAALEADLARVTAERDEALPEVGEEVVERITEMLGLWRGTAAGGCFAPRYIDSCDDTGCWCKKDCARNARAILALFTQKET